MSRPKPPRSLAGLAPGELAAVRARFMAKVQEVDGHWRWCVRGKLGEHRQECWFRLPFRLWRTPLNANRAAWLLFRGDIPEGQSVYSVCRAAGCVKPEHLATASPADTARRGGRGGCRRGDAAAKVTTEAEVHAVLAAWNAGRRLRQLRELAPRASDSLLASIVAGACWKHVLPRPVRRFRGAQALRGAGGGVRG
jgi:hypothetical protein